MLMSAEAAAPRLSRAPMQLAGGWELSLLVLMALLYLVGAALNPAFFGSADALHAVLRDTARYGVMAVGMTFVIVNKDLDLSVGSTYGLTGVVFAIIFSPTHFGLGLGEALIGCLLLGTFIGLLNGALVTILKVPAFIATLTTLLIGRGMVLGLTGGKNIAFAPKASEYPALFQMGETNALGFNNQIVIFFAVAAIGSLVLAKTRWGYETAATGGNEQAASYAGINTTWVRIRAYLISSYCATLAGLMAIFQDKGVTAQYGLNAELIVIASVIIGGASILGGRGRVIGSCLGALLTVLINKVLREGWPVTRTVRIGDVETQVNAVAQLPAGAVPAFIGLLLLVAVLIEPQIVRKRVPQRLWARLRGMPPPPLPDSGGVAIEGVQTKGAMGSDKALAAKGIWKFMARRDAFAILLAVALWFVGLSLRPDYWWHLQNSFAVLLNYTEVAMLAIGMTYVIANGDIDLSVGAVLALAAAATAYCLKVLGLDPVPAIVLGLLVGSAAGVINAVLTVGFGLSAFIATLGMFYIARGLAAWIVAGQQLTGFPEGFNLIGRKLTDIFQYLGLEIPPGILSAISQAVSIQTIWMFLIAIVAGVILARTPFGQKIYATGGNRRAAEYAGIDTKRVRFMSLAFSGVCAAMAGVIYVAFYRSFNPTAGQFRELDAIAAVIIGGGSIFGGYGSVLGSLAGAAVITLIRSLLSLQIITGPGTSFVMPQHWVNVFIGLILICAVLADIWIRQQGIIAEWSKRLGFGRRREV
ncbi:ABC transporter permease [Mesorhizobium sp. CN2-181]|uniref:ABC transporter permease n=1 Tax=Mesorhizobium yinganensis TaxID=3157707 RepID=UPI0032B75DCA